MTREEAARRAAENLKTVYAWALTKTTDKNDAQELTSEIVLASIENAPRLKRDEAFYGWFWQIARNTYKRYLTKRKKADVSLTDESDRAYVCEKTVEENVILHSEIRKLRSEIAFLGKYYRACTADYYFNDMSVREIAAKYSLTPEMVKYYLFKTRKILKEGLAMERQFGERSFNPVKFQLNEMYSGTLSREYRNLFHERKLPGQILSAAYYEPMTLRELGFELGVPTVYLEDELEVLAKYGFIKKTGDDRYQTNMFIYDNELLERCVSKIQKNGRNTLKKVAEGIKSKQEDFKKIGFAGCGLDGELIEWDSAVLCAVEMYKRSDFMHNSEKTKICDGAGGTVWGNTCTENADLYDMNFDSFSFSVGWYPDKKNIFSMILFRKSGFTEEDADEIYEKIKNTHDDPENAPVPSFTEAEYKKATELFSEEIGELTKFFGAATDLCIDEAMETAPKSIDLSRDMIANAFICLIITTMFDAFAKLGIRYPDSEFAGIYGRR